MRLSAPPVPTPGFNGPAGALRMGGLNYGLNGNIGAGWTQAAVAYGERVFSEQSVGTMEFLTNETVTHSYAIYPYADGTHELIQPNMLVFLSRHNDIRYRLYNMAPLFKMNVLQTESFIEFRNASTPDALKFKAFLREFGEQALEDYHCALKRGDVPTTTNEKLKAFYTLALKPEFIYMTKFGILQNWNFGGAVLSKGESTGAGAFLDHHASTAITYVVGLACAQRARVGNLWGKVEVGDQVYLMLTRQNADSPFVWIPYLRRDRPLFKQSSYTDASGRTCKAHLEYVGLVTEAFERVPSALQIEQAILIDGKNAKDGYEASASLANIIVQIRI